ncbi:MAG: VanZ family protein [Thermoguttaceae bacterium]
MCFVCRLACVAYSSFLTVLLLAPDPARVVGLSKRPEFPWGSFGVHWIALAILSFLVLGSVSPERLSWLPVVGLIVYGTAGELLQYFVPSRHVQWLDWMQNMLGVGTGLLAYWILLRRWGASRVSAANGQE